MKPLDIAIAGGDHVAGHHAAAATDVWLALGVLGIVALALVAALALMMRQMSRSERTR